MKINNESAKEGQIITNNQEIKIHLTHENEYYTVSKNDIVAIKQESIFYNISLSLLFLFVGLLYNNYNNIFLWILIIILIALTIYSGIKTYFSSLKKFRNLKVE